MLGESDVGVTYVVRWKSVNETVSRTMCDLGPWTSAEVWIRELTSVGEPMDYVTRLRER